MQMSSNKSTHLLRITSKSILRLRDARRRLRLGLQEHHWTIRMDDWWQIKNLTLRCSTKKWIYRENICGLNANGSFPAWKSLWTTEYWRAKWTDPDSREQESCPPQIRVRTILDMAVVEHLTSQQRQPKQIVIVAYEVDSSLERYPCPPIFLHKMLMESTMRSTTRNLKQIVSSIPSIKRNCTLTAWILTEWWKPMPLLWQLFIRSGVQLYCIEANFVRQRSSLRFFKDLGNLLTN